MLKRDNPPPLPPDLSPLGRYVVTLRREHAAEVGDEWKQRVVGAEGVRVLGTTRRNVAFEAAADAAEKLRVALGDRWIVEPIIERRIPDSLPPEAPSLAPAGAPQPGSQEPSPEGGAPEAPENRDG